ncbi:DUF397 domain-containing protein [Streptomyces cyaneofuscatus]|uniref:DUF397 domain-containing protein n=1 Tax=Streptomyces cyaneofuscatus TaxID=66883 RepID=UPI0033AD5FCF
MRWSWCPAAGTHSGCFFDWRKSSYSNKEGGECVGVATCPHTVHIRDSKVTDGPTFAVAPAAWTAFLDHATVNG